MTTSTDLRPENPEGPHDAPAAAPAPPRTLGPLGLLFAPDRAMERHALVGRARWFFLFAWLCSILLAAAVAYRVDARSSTLRKLEESEQLSSMSDRQIADETRSAERVFQVTTIAGGVARVPVQLGLNALAIAFLVWFFRGRLRGRAVVPIAAAALVPGALASLVDAVAALRHHSLPPEGAPLGPRSLGAVLALLGRPLTDPALRFGNALDFFSLWAALMLGFGVAAAGQVPRRTAVTGTLVGWVCIRLLTHVAVRS